MHEYTCTECLPRKFYTDFAPMFDEPAFCPCCGSSKQVDYIGIKQTGNPQPELDQMQKIVEKFYTYCKSGNGYSLSDLDTWIDQDFSELADLITNARMEVEKE